MTNLLQAFVLGHESAVVRVTLGADLEVFRIREPAGATLMSRQPRMMGPDRFGDGLGVGERGRVRELHAGVEGNAVAVEGTVGSTRPGDEEWAGVAVRGPAFLRSEGGSLAGFGGGAACDDEGARSSE